MRKESGMKWRVSDIIEAIGRRQKSRYERVVFESRAARIRSFAGGPTTFDRLLAEFPFTIAHTIGVMVPWLIAREPAYMRTAGTEWPAFRDAVADALVREARKQNLPKRG